MDKVKYHSRFFLYGKEVIHIEALIYPHQHRDFDKCTDEVFKKMIKDLGMETEDEQWAWDKTISYENT